MSSTSSRVFKEENRSGSTRVLNNLVILGDEPVPPKVEYVQVGREPRQTVSMKPAKQAVTKLNTSENTNRVFAKSQAKYDKFGGSKSISVFNKPVLADKRKPDTSQSANSTHGRKLP